MSNYYIVGIIMFFVIPLVWGCDPDRKKECEWYLVPELDHKHLVEGDWVPLCARNYDTNKQVCYLKSKLAFAEKVYGLPLRYSEIEIDRSTRPGIVRSVKPCQKASKNMAD